MSEGKMQKNAFPKPDWLQTLRHLDFHPVINLPSQYTVLDLKTGATYPEPEGFTIGRYDEVRLALYDTESYTSTGRNIHIGIDIGAPPDTEIYAFTDGRVKYARNNKSHKDYGPTLVTEHFVEGHYMPGVVSQSERTEALRKYPDPRIILGDLY